jgi:hypothetical protein
MILGSYLGILVAIFENHHYEKSSSIRFAFSIIYELLQR